MAPTREKGDGSITPGPFNPPRFVSQRTKKEPQIKPSINEKELKEASEKWKTLGDASPRIVDSDKSAAIFGLAFLEMARRLNKPFAAGALTMALKEGKVSSKLLDEIVKDGDLDFFDY